MPKLSDTKIGLSGNLIIAPEPVNVADVVRAKRNVRGVTQVIQVNRIGFAGFADADSSYDGPELALQAALRRMEEHGHAIVSVSMLRSSRERERYEAFVVSRHDGVLEDDGR